MAKNNLLLTRLLTSTMPQEMPSSWRYLTSARSHVSNMKGYLSGRESPSMSRTPRAQGGQQGDVPQSWRAWAGQKIRVRKRGTYGLGNVNTEVVNLFPGWAVRRYPMPLARTNYPSEGLSNPYPGRLLLIYLRTAIFRARGIRLWICH